MVRARAEAITPSSLPIEAASDVRAALEGMGRTEDLAFSPSCTRLAITGFNWNCIYVFELDKAERLSSGRIVLTDHLEISSGAIRGPHGVDFLDEDRIIVANRDGAVTIFWLPPLGYGAHELALNPMRTLRGSWRSRIASPGSVAVRQLEGDVEILVANNYRDTVTTHRLNPHKSYRACDNRLLLKEGLSVPDGVAISRDRQWVAVSNHGTHSVLIFGPTSELDPKSAPAAQLVGVDCPHGLKFSDDDRRLAVTSASSPLVHTYNCGETGEVDWRGTLHPASTFQVMDDETFLRGRTNPEEGGPKGLSLSGELNLLALTSEHQPLAFFDLAAVLSA